MLFYLGRNVRIGIQLHRLPEHHATLRTGHLEPGLEKQHQRDCFAFQRRRWFFLLLI